MLIAVLVLVATYQAGYAAGKQDCQKDKDKEPA